MMDASAHRLMVAVSLARGAGTTHLDDPAHGGVLGSRIAALDGVVDEGIDLGRAQVVQVGQELQRGGAVAFAGIAELVAHDGAQDRGVCGDDLGLLLELQALDEMAEGGEAGLDEGGRGGCGNGEANAFEDGGLALFGHAVVLDARLEGGEEGQAVVDVGGGLLQRAQQGGGVRLHGGCLWTGACGWRGSMGRGQARAR